VQVKFILVSKILFVFITSFAVVTAHCHRVEVVTKGWLLMGLIGL
jgi:hypothetical protein